MNEGWKLAFGLIVLVMATGMMESLPDDVYDTMGVGFIFIVLLAIVVWLIKKLRG